MTNYKQHDYDTVGTVNQHILKNDEKLVILYFNVNGGTTAKSLFDTSTEAIYQVPSGKIFTCVGFDTITTQTYSVVTISQGDTADAETLTKHITNATQTITKIQFIVNITFASTKFITVKAGATSVQTFYMYGYET